MCRLLIVLQITLLFCTCAEALIKWRAPSSLADEKIEIKMNYMKNSKTLFKEFPHQEKYDAHVRTLKNHTLDEKCEQGLDFGVGFQMTQPYSNVHFDGKTLTLFGIMPHAIREIMGYCCPKSNVTYGHQFLSIKAIEDHYSDDPELDLSFPLYGLDGKHSTQFKDYPFLPIVTAPRVLLLVPDKLFQELNSRTQVLLRTIWNTWPMLIFIIVSAMLSGLTVWCLDKKKNSDEFPPTFFSGAWEGVWWAFVTMTTVGYGDRSPKSPYARAFCIMWILLGIVLISLFTGLITAALSVSTTPVFNIAGAKIGAVRGSAEFQLAVGLNAEAKAYMNHFQLFTNLTEDRHLHGALMDNFILTTNTDFLDKTKLRIDREFEHPVTYGVVMKREGSTNTEKCFRKYLRRHPDKLFEIIAKELKPIKNPTDDTRLEVQAAEELDFYQEVVFKRVVYTEIGLLVCALLAGVVWEFFVRNKDSAAYRLIGRIRGKPKFAKAPEFDLDGGNKLMNNGRHGSLDAEEVAYGNNNRGLDNLIEEYNDYHTKWIERVKQISTNGISQ
eukprot:TCONS_00060853-protein